jgi:pilus assembly protein Flp/PilA
MANALIAVRTWLAEREDRGASLVEYALLVALIAVVCVVAITVLGQSASQSFSSTGSGFAAN